MRVLSIDYGKKRTGLAVTDPAQIIANALTTVDTSELMAFVMHYVATEPVERIVIGLPLQTNGLPSDRQSVYLDGDGITRLIVTSSSY